MSFFRHVLQKDRLGTEHASLDSYHTAVKQTAKKNDTDIPIEFSLVVVLSPNSTQKQRQETSSNISILLGKKLRGFGKGFYNCFGGKLERSLHEHLYPARGAVRELQEETGVHIPLSVMEDGYVGTLNFTFDDWEVNRAMKVYLYCMVVSFSAEEDRANTTHERDEQADITIDPNQIRGCEEIEPKWFNNVYEIPLNQMFADDSLWLTMLLKHYDDKFGSLNNKVQPSATLNDEYPNQSKFMFDGWFHFASGGADTNKILHHYLKPKHPGIVLCFSSAPPPPVVKYTLEKQLFHALHLNHIHSPSIKEFKENYAMVNAIRKYLGSEERMEYVIDVAGGHGALGKYFANCFALCACDYITQDSTISSAALFLVLTKKCHNAIVIDPAVVNGKEGILQAWSPFWNGDNNGAGRGKSLRYRHECLRIGLRDELDKILKRQTHDGTGSLVSPTSVLVVACHACQHLTDETMQIASEYGVNVGKSALFRGSSYRLVLVQWSHNPFSLHAVLSEGSRWMVEKVSKTNGPFYWSNDGFVICWQDDGMANRLKSRREVPSEDEID
jgi:ADP-ribose pyrophosphatase YjhB (NUDIX family)